jgi:integrase
MARNSNGEGSIYQWKKNGKPAGYKGAISYSDENGNTKRYVAYGRTRQLVRDKLDKARERLTAGAPVRDAKQTVGDWLAQWRVTILAASDRSESTRALYASLSRKHLEPAPFGAVPLDKLRPSDIDALVLAMRAKMKSAKIEDAEPLRALSDSTIRQTYTVLRAALEGAVRDGLIARNPTALVTRPGVQRHEARHLDASGVAALLRAAQASRYYPALVLIAATGLRKGECLALSWDTSIVNLDDGWLKVRKTSAGSVRNLCSPNPRLSGPAARCRSPPPSPRCCVSARQPRPPTSCGKYSVAGLGSGLMSSAARWTHATSCVLSRSPQRPPASRTSVSTPCGTPRPSRGSNPASTSRRWPICSGTRRLRSPATCMGTPAMTRHGPRWTAWLGGSGCETYPASIQIVPAAAKTATTASRIMSVV